jgi:hypothetical protein
MCSILSPSGVFKESDGFDVGKTKHNAALTDFDDYGMRFSIMEVLVDLRLLRNRGPTRYRGPRPGMP